MVRIKTGWRNDSERLVGALETFLHEQDDLPLLVKILTEITGQARHRRFRYDAYVRLFDEESGG